MDLTFSRLRHPPRDHQRRWVFSKDRRTAKVIKLSLAGGVCSLANRNTNCFQAFGEWRRWRCAQHYWLFLGWKVVTWHSGFGIGHIRIFVTPLQRRSAKKTERKIKSTLPYWDKSVFLNGFGPYRVPHRPRLRCPGQPIKTLVTESRS